MRKRFRFTMDLDIDMKETVCDSMPNSDMITSFLKEFIKDNQSILELCKIYLLCDLQYDAFSEHIRKSLVIPDPINDDHLYTSVLKKCPVDVKDHFLKLFENGKAWESKDFEVFLDHLGRFQFKGANLEEVID